MASEADVKPEPTAEGIDFEGSENTTMNTAWVKWDVKGGSDRTHSPYMNTAYSLEGSPNIQGVEIKASQQVKLICWTSQYPNGSPDITIDGPTNGKHKINPRRLGSYRVEPRN
ncbi:hypothetical protein CDD81_7875 [Ophiocordyceps australis]|uniref:Uncharacterized protein n=1 Tax=Ophiocordyceps australis TaxID=1399860 RepID=A0A2C5YG59_9HYPO|nr:hypothetical protein CDD81_7875 [Ophiocordyceps australis]